MYSVKFYKTFEYMDFYHIYKNNNPIEENNKKLGLCVHHVHKKIIFGAEEFHELCSYIDYNTSFNIDDDLLYLILHLENDLCDNKYDFII